MDTTFTVNATPYTPNTGANSPAFSGNEKPITQPKFSRLIIGEPRSSRAERRKRNAGEPPTEKKTSRTLLSIGSSLSRVLKSSIFKRLRISKAVPSQPASSTTAPTMTNLGTASPTRPHIPLNPAANPAALSETTDFRPSAPYPAALSETTDFRPSAPYPAVLSETTDFRPSAPTDAAFAETIIVPGGIPQDDMLDLLAFSDVQKRKRGLIRTTTKGPALNYQNRLLAASEAVTKVLRPPLDDRPMTVGIEAILERAGNALANGRTNIFEVPQFRETIGVVQLLRRAEEKATAQKKISPEDSMALQLNDTPYPSELAYSRAIVDKSQLARINAAHYTPKKGPEKRLSLFKTAEMNEIEAQSVATILSIAGNHIPPHAFVKTVNGTLNADGTIVSAGYDDSGELETLGKTKRYTELTSKEAATILRKHTRLSLRNINRLTACFDQKASRTADGRRYFTHLDRVHKDMFATGTAARILALKTRGLDVLGQKNPTTSNDITEVLRELRSLREPLNSVWPLRGPRGKATGVTGIATTILTSIGLFLGIQGASAKVDNVQRTVDQANVGIRQVGSDVAVVRSDVNSGIQSLRDGAKLNTAEVIAAVQAEAYKIRQEINPKHTVVKEAPNKELTAQIEKMMPTLPKNIQRILDNNSGNGRVTLENNDSLSHHVINPPSETEPGYEFWTNNGQNSTQKLTQSIRMIEKNKDNKDTITTFIFHPDNTNNEILVETISGQGSKPNKTHYYSLKDLSESHQRDFKKMLEAIAKAK